jgi:hypothetical protein
MSIANRPRCWAGVAFIQALDFVLEDVAVRHGDFDLDGLRVTLRIKPPALLEPPTSSGLAKLLPYLGDLRYRRHRREGGFCHLSGQPMGHPVDETRGVEDLFHLN